MKLKNLLFVAILILGTTGVFAQISKMAPKVVLIGIGEKNPTLDESKYPNLEFYYTPGLKSNATASATTKSALSIAGVAKETFSGEPKFIETIWNEKQMQKGFMLFDKNGLCVTQGYEITRQGGDIGRRLCADKDKLQDHLKDYVKKEKEGKKSKKDMKMKKSDFMIGHNMPEFNVVTPSGEEKPINDIIKGQPTLVVFFQLASDVDIEEGKKSDQSDKSGKELFAAATQAAAGADLTQVFVELESQFFNYDARD